MRDTERQTGLPIILCWLEGEGCGSLDSSLRPRSTYFPEEGRMKSKPGKCLGVRQQEAGEGFQAEETRASMLPS